MLIKTRLTEKDYINATFVILFSRIGVKIFLTIYLLAIFSGGLIKIILGKIDYLQLISPFFFLILFSAVIYFRIKKNFAKNPRTNETIEYLFESEMLIIKGESFSSQFTWSKIPNVVLTKNWLLIWQNRQMANAIPRRDIWSGEMEKLKDILLKQKVKNNLP